MAKYVTFYGGPMAAGHNVKDAPEGETPEELMAKIMAHFPAPPPPGPVRCGREAANGRSSPTRWRTARWASGAAGKTSTTSWREDPFLLHGLVRSWRLMEWNETQLP